MTVRVASSPQLTPLFETLYFAGSNNEWDAGSAEHSFERMADGTFYYTLNLATPGATVEYKITRGDWERVEGTLSGGYLANRTLVYNPGSTEEISIAGWEDLPGNHTVTPGVRIIDTRFAVPQLSRTRRIWIYLPPGYATSQEQYPVWYVHDGQNVFDAATSFAGEWRWDETMDASINGGCPEAIVVAIDNGGADRIHELTPWENAQYNAGGEGNQYLQFISNSLKPFIDAQFRTMPEREHTCIAGSSLGGLISAYAIIEFGNVFGKAAIFSPAFWFNDEELLNAVTDTDVSLEYRLFMIGGQNESNSMVTDMSSMRSGWIATGIPLEDILLTVDPNGQHTESSWAAQLPDAYEWVSECGQVSVPSLDIQPVLAYPNPFTDTFHVTLSDRTIIRSVSVRDSNGREIFTKDHLQQSLVQISLAHVVASSYSLVVTDTQGKTFSTTLIKR
jgi:predicted alpha/beta superfamily hydrolase